MPPIHGIRPPAPVNLDSNPADIWRLFRQKWQNYATITQLQMQPTEYQFALFLHTIGDAALQIYNGFTFDTDDDSRSVADILAKFDNFAFGEINECYERFVFHNRNQQQNELFEQFLTSIAQQMSTKSTSHEMSRAEVMHHGAETNKGNTTHIIHWQTVQVVIIAVENISRMKHILRRDKLATSVSSQTTSKKCADEKSRQTGRCDR